MSAHTPGPWTARKHTDTKGWTVSSKAGLEASSIASVRPRREVEANALLIAAAPELLACLKEAVASWELADEDADAEPGDGEALAAWKAAIAKAEGRS